MLRMGSCVHSCCHNMHRLSLSTWIRRHLIQYACIRRRFRTVQATRYRSVQFLVTGIFEAATEHKADDIEE